MNILGIDPGLHGALALLDTRTGHLLVEDMPVHVIRQGNAKKRRVDLYGLASIITDWLVFGIDQAVIEEVSAMPQQGVTSTFNFGKVAGIAEMAVAAHSIPMETVRPQIWKKAMGLQGQDKDASRRKASEVMPWFTHYWRRKKDDGRAESALLAYWRGTR